MKFTNPYINSIYEYDTEEIGENWDNFSEVINEVALNWDEHRELSQDEQLQLFYDVLNEAASVHLKKK